MPRVARNWSRDAITDAHRIVLRESIDELVQRIDPRAVRPLVDDDGKMLRPAVHEPLLEVQRDAVLVRARRPARWARIDADIHPIAHRDRCLASERVRAKLPRIAP